MRFGFKQPLVGEKRCVMTPITAAEETTTGGVLHQKLGVGVWPASQNPYLFLTKTCNFPFPIYDKTKNAIPSVSMTVQAGTVELFMKGF